MKEERRFPSTKRFGARYGRRVKQRFGEIEEEQRKLHKCPYCNALKVKRLSIGIWNCGKCGAKFTGKAYSVRKKIVFKQVEESDEPVKTEESDEAEEDMVEEQGTKKPAKAEELEKEPEKPDKKKEDKNG